jgi:hypothetical protein
MAPLRQPRRLRGSPQHFATIAEHNAWVFEVLVCQLLEDREVNSVLQRVYTDKYAVAPLGERFLSGGFSRLQLPRRILALAAKKNNLQHL